MKRLHVPSLSLFLVSVVALLTSGALSDPQRTPRIAIQGAIVASLPVDKIDRSLPLRAFAWCSRSAPALAYISHQSVWQVAFGDSPRPIMKLDLPARAGWVECGDGADVVVAFVSSPNQLHLFIKNGADWGRYRASGITMSQISSFGRLLSPDGKTIVAPFDIVYEAGTDVLGMMKVLRINGTNFAWQDDDFAYYDSRTHSIRFESSRSGETKRIVNLDQLFKGGKYNVSGIVSCDGRTLLGLSSIMADAEMTKDGRRITSQVIDLQSLAKVSSAVGQESSVIVGGSTALCVISRVQSTGPDERRMYELLVDREIAKYIPPGGVDIGYPVAVSPHECMILGEQYEPRQDGLSGMQLSSIVAIRITAPGHCARR